MISTFGRRLTESVAPPSTNESPLERSDNDVVSSRDRHAGNLEGCNAANKSDDKDVNLAVTETSSTLSDVMHKAEQEPQAQIHTLEHVDECDSQSCHRNLTSAPLSPESAGRSVDGSPDNGSVVSSLDDRYYFWPLEDHCEWPDCVLHIRSYGEWFRHAIQYEEIDVEANRGCPSCALVRQVLDGVCSCRLRGQGLEDDCVPEDDCVHSCKAIRYYKKPWITAEWSCGVCDVEVRQPRQPEDVSYGQMNTLSFLLALGAGDVAADPISADSIRLYKRWMNECDASHYFCRQASSGTLPTRVLELAGDAPDGPTRL